MLTSKQRAALSALANSENTLFQIGKSGITPALIEQTDSALEARELIKLRVLETAPEGAREAAEELADATDSEVVRVIGTRIILYRHNKKNTKISLPK